ncbi:MAG: response regulator [Salinispira sp.]
MKKVLIIDNFPSLREFLRLKFINFEIEVIESSNGLDGYAKFNRFEPDLVIMDYFIPRLSAVDFLKRKRDNPNLKKIPVLIITRKIPEHTIIELHKLGVQKIITKPIRIELLSQALQMFLGITLNIDLTPCIIDAHYNDEVLFVEIARGLNTDKLELLRYRLRELMKFYRINDPKVIILFTAIEFFHDDFAKFRSLIHSVRDATGVCQERLKILTGSDIIRTFMHKLGGNFQPAIHDNLADIIKSLLGIRSGGYTANGKIHEDFLRLERSDGGEDDNYNLSLRGKHYQDIFSEHFTNNFSPALVDADSLTHTIFRKTFIGSGGTIKIFNSGADFMTSSGLQDFDLLFLALSLPDVNSIKILEYLTQQNIDLPVIALVTSMERNLVIQALRKGIKCCLLKPINPDIIIRKSLELLQLSF